MTEQRLVRGWATGTAGVRVRLATVADLAAVEPLLATADVELNEAIVEAVQHDVMGRAHRAGLAARGPEHGAYAYLRALATALVNPGDGDVIRVASLLLVAEHKVDGVLGTVLAYPPPNVVGELVNRADRLGAARKDVQKLIACGTMGLAKVSGLAVADRARRQGIGAALLSRIKRLYFHVGYIYVFGQIPPRRPGLEEFYRRQGFAVKGPGEGLDLEVVFGFPTGIYPGRGERFFVRERPPTER